MKKGDSVKEKHAGCGLRGNVKVSFKPAASEGFIRK
jgi:hypothetical protein